MNQDLIERILYYRFKGVFFKYIDHFWFQPFTLRAKDADGVDPYGRYDYVSPVVFTGAWEMKKGEFEDRPFLPEKASNVSIPVMYGQITDKPEFPGIILTGYIIKYITGHYSRSMDNRTFYRATYRYLSTYKYRLN